MKGIHKLKAENYLGLKTRKIFSLSNRNVDEISHLRYDSWYEIPRLIQPSFYHGFLIQG